MNPDRSWRRAVRALLLSRLAPGDQIAAEIYDHLRSLP